LLIGLPFFLWGMATNVEAANWEKIKSLIGPEDSLLVAGSKGRIIVAINERQKRVPASILKIFTSLGALHYLGTDFRFKTEFFMDAESNLKIKGYGDPLLTSEIVNAIAQSLASRIGRATPVNDIVVDDSYFTQPLTIPGISSSSQPYDAPNGALADTLTSHRSPGISGKSYCSNGGVYSYPNG